MQYKEIKDITFLSVGRFQSLNILIAKTTIKFRSIKSLKSQFLLSQQGKKIGLKIGTVIEDPRVNIAACRPEKFLLCTLGYGSAFSMKSIQ